MSHSKACIQFTGGKDSTLVAAKTAREVGEVHLLSFRNSMVTGMELVPLNIGKLKFMFGEEKFQHTILNNEALLKELYAGKWFRDLLTYKTYAANNLCGACRLSMATETIVYCLDNEISLVRDGANRTGFDLSQQPWALDVFRKFYGEYGIEYEPALYETSRNDIELLKLGLNSEKPTIFFRSQPLCRGGGEVHNIYLRCYFLPRYGRTERVKRDLQWLDDRLAICRSYISRRVGMRTPACCV